MGFAVLCVLPTADWAHPSPACLQATGGHKVGAQEAFAELESWDLNE